MPLPVSMDATWMLGSTSFNAQELRRADTAEFNGDGTAFGVRGGIVRHGDTSLAVTVSVADVLTIQPGAVVIPGNTGVGNGVYRAALGAAETGNLVARNATNPRIDLVVFRVYDDDVVTTHNLYTGRIEVITGVPAASPAVPALPTLAVELARVTVPASGGAAATVDSSWRQYASALGGVLPVASSNRLPATAVKGQKAFAIDTGKDWVFNGTVWQRDGGILYRGATGATAGIGDITYCTTPDLGWLSGRSIRLSTMGVYNPAGANTGIVFDFYRAINGAAGVPLGYSFYHLAGQDFETGYDFQFVDNPPVGSCVYYVRARAHYLNGAVISGAQFTVEDIGPAA